MPKPKSIVVCCDGTWNKADSQWPTNVERFHAALDRRPGKLEATYIPGVGTEPNFFDKYLGGIFGLGLYRRVREAYEYIVKTYVPGDRIYLVGFSRGAYTARSTAGLIRNVGVLKRGYTPELLSEALTIYRNRRDDASKPDGRAAEDFRVANSHTADIHFIGVWDTVGALGIPLGGGLRWLNFLNRGSQFHDTQLSSSVKAAYHALAVDERRRPFEPTLWKLSDKVRNGSTRQEVEQVWFSGVHCNVGGGYEDAGLSDIALQWMADKAKRHGLDFKPGTLGTGSGKIMIKDRELSVNPWAEGAIRNSRTSVYRLSRPLIRSIGQAKSLSTEWAASTARQRMDDAAYLAPNLCDYLDRRRGRTASMVHIVGRADIARSAVGRTRTGPNGSVRIKIDLKVQSLPSRLAGIRPAFARSTSPANRPVLTVLPDGLSDPAATGAGRSGRRGFPADRATDLQAGGRPAARGAGGVPRIG